MEEGFSQIGVELMQHAADTAEFSASRGVVTELFPYIYASSRMMSSRAISRWLQSEHKIKLSAVTIAKALREPDKHWIGYTEQLETPIRILVEAFPNFAAEDFVTDERIFGLMIGERPMVKGESPDHVHFSLTEIAEAIEILQEKWFLLPESIRGECVHYLLVQEPEQEKAD
jgi:hypothetical protein